MDSNQIVPAVTDHSVTTSKTESAVYARFSEANRQRDSSIEDQVRDCRCAADRNDNFIPEQNVFADYSVRGTVEDRQQLNRLLTIVKSGRATFSVIYVTDTSRLSRDSAFAAKLRKVFKFYKIRLVFVEDGLDSNSSGFELNHTFKAYIDEQYSVDLGRKVTRGAHGRLLNGYHPAGKCYGYRNVPDEDPSQTELYGRPKVKGVNLVINPVEAGIIVRVYEMYASGEGGYGYVAGRLNELGVLSPRLPHKDKIRGWNHAAVRNILKNPRYIGIMIYGRMETVRDPETKKVLHRERPSSDWVQYINEDLRIVPQELWDRVQAQMKSRREQSGHKLGGMARSPASRHYLFSGLLICDVCGGSMVMTNGANGGYRCNSARRKLGCRNSLLIKRKSLEQLLMERLVTSFQGEALFSQMKALLLVEVAKQQQRDRKIADKASWERGTLLDELQHLNQQIDNLVNAVGRQGLSPALSNALAQAEGRKTTISEQLARSPQTTDQVSEEEIQVFLREALADLASILLGDSLRTKQELQKRISSLRLAPITYAGDKAYQITGDLALFPGLDEVMPTRTVQSICQQHCSSLDLTGIILSINERGVVTAVIGSPQLSGEEDLLDQAA